MSGQLNRRKEEPAEELSRRMREVTHSALGLVMEAVQSGDVKIAMAWLRMAKLQTPDHPTPTL